MIQSHDLLSHFLFSYWSIYKKTLFKILLFIFLRIFLSCFSLTLLFSAFQSIKTTINRIFFTCFFIPHQHYISLRYIVHLYIISSTDTCQVPHYNLQTYFTKHLIFTFSRYYTAFFCINHILFTCLCIK